MFFFFKQKTAYEMRISDWSSDVCSSDLTTPSDIGLSVQWRHFGSVKQDTTSSQPALEGTSQPAHGKLRAMNYIALAATFRVMDNYNFRLGVNNVFDSKPQLAGSQACPAVVCANTSPQVVAGAGSYISASLTPNISLEGDQ